MPEVMSGRVERRRVPRVHLRPVGRTSGRRLAVCLYTPSYDPSGMGGHMVDLAAEYAPDVDVTVMAWPTAAGQRLLDAVMAHPAIERCRHVELQCKPDLVDFYARWGFAEVTGIVYMRRSEP